MTVPADFQSWVHTRQTRIESVLETVLAAPDIAPQRLHQAMRYAVIPQAVRRVIPPLMNEFVILIKDTALVIVLGLTAENFELYTYAREIYSDTGNASAFVATAFGYLVVTLPLIRIVNAVESRLRSGLTGAVGAH